MIVDIQLDPAVEPWESLRDGVLLAERSGFSAAWVFDHFDGSLLRGTTMLECFTLLGALAAATTTIGLGTLVVNVANRNPGLMAMAAASAQAISGGRLLLGVGAGAAPGTAWSAEHRELGIELAPTVVLRHERLEAALDELDRWWDPARDARLASYPIADPRPPVVIGANSRGIARLAGRRAEGINVRGTHDELEAIVGAAREARTSGAAFEVSVWAEWDEALVDPGHPWRRRWADLGVDRLVLVCLARHDPASVARVGAALADQR